MVWNTSAFQLLIISATGGFTGLFVYAPIPGPGNLIASMAPAAGTDPYGNPYVQGIADYAHGTPAINVQMTAGGIQFNQPAVNGAASIGSNSTTDLIMSSGRVLVTDPETILDLGKAGLALTSGPWYIIDPSGDTTGAADSLQFTLAFGATIKPSVLMMPGTYYINAPIVPPSGIVLRGFSGTGNPSANFGAGGLPMQSTVIKAVAGFAGTAMIQMVSSGSQIGGQRIERIALDGSGGPGGIDAIQAIGAVAQVKLRDIATYGGAARKFTYGLHLDSNADGNPDAWDVDACAFQLSNTAGVGLLAGVADSFWRNVSCTASNADGWRIVNGNGSRYLFCKGETSVTGFGFNITGAAGYTGFSHFVACSGGANFLGDFSVAGTGTGTLYFDMCHGNSAAVWTYGGTMNVKTPAAYNVSTAAPTFN